MRIIRFKTQYILKVDMQIKLVINPIERILQGLKSTTFRINPKKLELYNVVTGSYYKPKYHNLILDFFDELELSICELSHYQIQKDLGLTNSEFEMLVEKGIDIHQFFLEGVRRINHIKTLELNDKCFLYYFKQPELKKYKTLENFIGVKTK